MAAATGAATLLFGLAIALPIAGECKECKPDTLCRPHDDQEAAALPELRGKVRAKNATEATAALAKIAALTDAHKNAPSRAVADTLAIGLVDVRFIVRATAAELVAAGQHPDAAVKALTRAMADVRGDFAKLGRGSTRGSRGDSILEGDGLRYLNAVVLGLARLPDDRGVDVLADTLKSLRPDAANELVNPVVAALQQLGSREAIRAILQRFVAAEGTNGKARGGAAGGGGAGGGGAGGGGGSGGGRAPGDRDGDGFRDQGADAEQRQALHDALCAAAAAKQLSDVPPMDTRAAQAWKDWFDRHQGAFAARLGRVGSGPVPEAAPGK